MNLSEITKECIDPSKYNKGQVDVSTSKKTIRATVALDWLEFFGDAVIPVSEEGVENFQLSDAIGILYRGHGTTMYNAFYEVYWEGEKFGTLQAHPRWLRGKIKATSIQFKIENSFLYTKNWLEGIKELQECGFDINNVTRCDIAVDGADVANFCNEFFKQNPSKLDFKMKGRADFVPTSLNKETMEFKSFRVGSSGSEKQATIYNKSAEIRDNSNKNYITEFWKNSGLDISEDVFRVEMRFKSKAVSKFKDFDYTKLIDPTYLASMFETGAKNFFEFVHDTGDSNKSREEVVQLIPYNQLGANLLEKEKQEETTDEYKAKLAIHLMFKIVLFQDLQGEEAREYAKMTNRFVDMYNLEDWYDRKGAIWIEEYLDMSEAKKKAKAHSMLSKNIFKEAI